MNSLPKVVCSRTLQAADWNNTLVKHDAAQELAKLKQQGNGNMFVFGSANLSKTLMDERLFDEYRLELLRSSMVTVGSCLVAACRDRTGFG